MDRTCQSLALPWSCLFLPGSKGGLQLPLISITFKKLQCAKAASLLTSRYHLVCHLASQKTLTKASAQRQSFKSYQQVVKVPGEDPKKTRKDLAAKVKGRVVQMDTLVGLEHYRSPTVQGQTMRQFDDCGTDLSSTHI